MQTQLIFRCGKYDNLVSSGNLANTMGTEGCPADRMMVGVEVPGQVYQLQLLPMVHLRHALTATDTHKSVFQMDYRHHVGTLVIPQ